jgi:predicted aminopeptidase
MQGPRRPRILAAALCLAALAGGLSSCYVGEQARAFLALQARAKSAASLLSDPKTPQKTRDLLLRVARIRSYAIATLGLKDTRNYTSLVELDADRLATVVQACAELSFDRYLWTYPVVGKLPYQGFFKPADAEKEAARLRKLGWDVIVRPVDAFSTLGWFADPLYSFMDAYGEADLAELVIHEMTHATAFSKAPGDFNEELATFVGRAGADAYLAASMGAASPLLAEARLARKEAEAFSAFLRGTAKELETVYAKTETPEAKRAEKAAVLAARARLFHDNYDELFETGRYRSFPMDKINNAWLDLYRLYEGEPELYADYLGAVCGGDLVVFIREAARLAKARGDPKALMREELAAARGGR